MKLKSRKQLQICYCQYHISKWFSKWDQNRTCFKSYSFAFPIAQRIHKIIKQNIRMELHFSFMNPFNRNMQFIDNKMFFFRFHWVLQRHVSAQCLSNCIRSTTTANTKHSEYAKLVKNSLRNHASPFITTETKVKKTRNLLSSLHAGNYLLIINAMAY